MYSRVIIFAVRYRILTLDLRLDIQFILFKLLIVFLTFFNLIFCIDQLFFIQITIFIALAFVMVFFQFFDSIHLLM